MFGYKQSLLMAHQRSDIGSKIGLILYSAMYTLQIAVLFLFHNYYWYILWLPVCTIMTNLSSAVITDRMCPEYKCRGEISREKMDDIRKKVLALFGTKANSIVLLRRILWWSGPVLYGLKKKNLKSYSRKKA